MTSPMRALCQVAKRYIVSMEATGRPAIMGSAVRGMRVKMSQKWVPSVRQDRCHACGLCGSICPYGCLDLLDGSGALVRAEACTSEEYCISACPEGAIHMIWARAEGDRSVGRWRSNGPPPFRSRQPGTLHVRPVRRGQIRDARPTRNSGESGPESKT